MIKGLYAAASGMIALERRQDIYANNISNSSTPGFRRHTPVQYGFSEVFTNTMRHGNFFLSSVGPGGGVKSVESFPSATSGSLLMTGNPLNVALNGPGFMVVETERGERYTRNGNFVVDAQGDLATSSGEKVLGIGGQPIQVDGGTVVISNDGSITVAGAAAGQLRLIEFEEPERLMREGDSLYAAADELVGASVAAENTLVQQAHVEQSNVEVTGEMMNLTLGMRAYEANQRVIQAIDESVGRLIDQVGMPT